MIAETKKNNISLIFLIFFAFTLTFQSCKKSRSDMGNVLFKKSDNKVFKGVTPEGFAEVFKQVIADKKSKLANPKLIAAFYEQNGYDPIFVMDHLPNDDLKALGDYYHRSFEHGLQPKIFQEQQVRNLINKFYDKRAIKSLNEAYHDMAELELLTANSLINYSNAMQYGLISPRKIYARYYTETKRPDSASMTKVFYIKNLKAYLDSIQPKSPQYIALQKALKDSITAPGMTREETERALVVNLERLRWKNKPSQNKYVLVNIPDYRLDVIENGKSVLNMKVCVGEGRNKDNSDTLVEYDESDKVDRPFSRETPQLNSVIHSVQVNPVWNIPQSIVTKEIFVEAQKDPYYLANKNIDVYKDGVKIDDPETINWSEASNDNSGYEFKQQPGDDNSLGKIKFLFNNKSSVYLHDTPAKAPFDQRMRAVSHGCVRLGNPQGLALELFGNSRQYDTIAKDMGEDNPTPTTIPLPNKAPVYITYVTCWADENGTLQFRPDVYGLDIVLYAYLQRFLN